MRLIDTLCADRSDSDSPPVFYTTYGFAYSPYTDTQTTPDDDECRSPQGSPCELSLAALGSVPELELFPPLPISRSRQSSPPYPGTSPTLPGSSSPPSQSDTSEEPRHLPDIPDAFRTTAMVPHFEYLPGEQSRRPPQWVRLENAMAEAVAMPGDLGKAARSNLERGKAVVSSRKPAAHRAKPSNITATSANLNGVHPTRLSRVPNGAANTFHQRQPHGLSTSVEFRPRPRLPPTPFRSEPQASSSRQPLAPASHPNALPVATPRPGMRRYAASVAPPRVPPLALDAGAITYDSLRAHVQAGAVLRVHHWRSRARLEWNGSAASSGFSAAQTSFRGLSPAGYATALAESGMGSGWITGPYVSETAREHVFGLGKGDAEASPWISATANLDCALWAVARALVSGDTHNVRLALIYPTTEIRVAVSDVLKRAPGTTALAQRRAADVGAEWLFYGRIFADSVRANISFSREHLPFSLPSKFWTSIQGRPLAGGWIEYLRWNAREATWPRVAIKLGRQPAGGNWDSQPVNRQNSRWPPREGSPAVKSPPATPARPRRMVAQTTPSPKAPIGLDDSDSEGQLHPPELKPSRLAFDLRDEAIPHPSIHPSWTMASTPLSSPVQAAQTHSRNLSGGSSRGTRRTRSESSEGSSSSDDPGAHRTSRSHSPDLAPLLAEVPVYIVPAKLDVGEVIARVEALGGERVLEPGDARVVVTALRGRPRLERVLGKAVNTAAILRAEFIADAYERARGGGQSLPNWDDYRVHIRGPSIEPIGPSTPTSAVFSPRTPETPTSRKRPADAVIHGSPGDTLSSPRPAKRAHTEHREATGSPKPVAAPDDLDTDVAPYPDDIPLGDIPRLACLRPSPLTCPNQDIIDAIKPIYLEREFDEMAQINTNVLSYRRSMAILKSVPRRIKSGAEARKLVDIGAKVANRIDEYLETGEIAEAQEILKSERYQALQLFASVYSVGHATAAMLWRDGCRDLADVRAYFARHDRPPPTLDEEGVPDRATRRQDRARYRRQMSGTMTREEIVDSWIDLKDELDQGIPRDEVDEIAACVAEHLAALSPGCEQTVTGGFRRGKASTGDVDVVFRPANAGGDAGLLKALYMRLARFGIVTHVLQVTERVGGNPLTHSGANFDNLDKAFVIFRLPSAAGKPARLHRRVDLICAPVERYAAAVLSWSGSMMFERDLRRWAEDRGYKFRAGVIHMATHREVNFATEREIFHFLGLHYVPPTLRNADG